MNKMLSMLSRLPTDHKIVFKNEVCDDGEIVLNACMFIEPPEDGWKSWGQRFGTDSAVPCPDCYKFDDVVGVAVNGDNIIENLTEAVKRYLDKFNPQNEAPTEPTLSPGA